MDTSDKYIKMCEGAKEIQVSYGNSQKKKRDFAFGDFICYERGVYVVNEHTAVNVLKEKILDTVEALSGLPEEKKYLLSYKYIWLPRQDQLQEMLDFSSYELVYKFDDFCRGDRGMYGESGIFDRDGRNYSMEQLWLAFVMKEKYGMVWDNESESWK